MGSLVVLLLAERARGNCARATAAIETIPRVLCPEGAAVRWPSSLEGALREGLHSEKGRRLMRPTSYLFSVEPQ